jgi:putative ABC transport system substrate-binding protein
VKLFGSFVIVAALFFALCASANAQQSGKIYRIGYLDPAASNNTVLLAAFRQELGKLGWNEGKNFTIEHLDYKAERVPELAADVVRLKVDLILVSGAQPASMAKRATATIPIVMTNVVDPVGGGLIASLARPGGNVTGVSGLAELGTKRLEILKDTVPKLVRVGVLRLPLTNIATDLQLKELRPAAVALKLKLEEIETQADSKSMEDAFQSAKQKQVGAIMTVAVRSFSLARKQIVELAGKYRLPAIYPNRPFVDEGGLMSYGDDNTEAYRRAAGYVDKILKGAKPADLPVQQATKFEFIVNLKAAKQIGLTIPVRVLERANQVIK